MSIFDCIEYDVLMNDSKNFSNDSFFDDFRFSSDLKCLLCVDFLSDKLVLKRFSSLICSNSCQIACFVEIRSDASRCLKFWSKCVYDFCYCRTNELDVNVDLKCVERLHELIEKQIIESVLEFFRVQTISVESLEECDFVDWDVQNCLNEEMIRVVIQIRSCLANQNSIIEILNCQTHVDDWF